MNSVMQKLVYKDAPHFSNYPQYRGYLAEVSDHACSYCTISESESPGATFNIDHFRPYKHFPNLVNECTNLRYSCPRCNSYKRDNWLTSEDGCTLNCSTCASTVCGINIGRFINTLEEDPAQLIELNDEMSLVPINDSKVAAYTIQMLRLNRQQLVKLRKVRRDLALWKSLLLSRKSIYETLLEEVECEHKKYAAVRTSASQAKVIELLFEMLRVTISHALSTTSDEIQHVDNLIFNRKTSETDYSSFLG